MEVSIFPSLQKGFGFIHLPIPVLHCVHLTNGPTLCIRSYTGLPRSVQITGWVRCCLYTGRTTSMCLHLTCSHPVFLPFWPMCINNFHIFAHDGTSTTVHFNSPYHPSRHLLECCYLSGSFAFPAASHPNVAIDACAGRLLMMEHEIKSI